MRLTFLIILTLLVSCNGIDTTNNVPVQQSLKSKPVQMYDTIWHYVDTTIYRDSVVAIPRDRFLQCACTS
jgi:hypothetical protein